MRSILEPIGVVLLAFGVAVGTAGAQTPQASTEMMTVKSADTGTWSPVPDIFPKGAEMQVLMGDPAKGPADYYFRVPSNYTFPWHFHTPIEKLFMDAGTLRWEMRDKTERTTDAGDYVYIPSRSAHRVTCTSSTPCLFYLSSNGPLDVHLIDESGKTTRSWRAADHAGE